MTDRPVRDCQHPGAPHKHGTLRAYQADRCRCEACSHAQWKSDHYRAIRRQREGALLVDATPTRLRLEHIVRTLGISALSVQKVTGISHVTVLDILGSEEGRKVYRDTERAIAAFRVEDLPPEATISAHGAVRRLQALSAIGYGRGYIQRATGARTHNIVARRDGKPASHINIRKHWAIAEFYEKHHTTPMNPTGRQERMMVSRAINEARRHGWRPPAAWDDIDLDPYPPHVERDSLSVDPEDVRHLLASGHTTTQICERLNVIEYTTVVKAVERGGDEALLNKLRVQRAEEFDKPLPGDTTARKAA